jgi:xanthine dehydrogenase accessory factor
MSNVAGEASSRGRQGGKFAAVKDGLDDIERWQGGRPCRLVALARVSLARVVAVTGSGPREPGAAMAVNDKSGMAGSVSGGCVEAAVMAEALEVLACREPPALPIRLFGPRSVLGWAHPWWDRPDFRGAAGRMDSSFGLVGDCLRAGRPVALATVIEVLPPDGATEALPRLGAKLVVRPDGEPASWRGGDDLDRVVIRNLEGARAKSPRAGSTNRTSSDRLDPCP